MQVAAKVQEGSHVRHCCAQLAAKSDELEKLRAQELAVRAKLRQAEENLELKARTVERVGPFVDRLESSLRRIEAGNFSVLESCSGLGMPDNGPGHAGASSEVAEIRLELLAVTAELRGQVARLQQENTALQLLLQEQGDASQEAASASRHLGTRDESIGDANAGGAISASAHDTGAEGVKSGDLMAEQQRLFDEIRLRLQAEVQETDDALRSAEHRILQLEADIGRKDAQIQDLLLQLEQDKLTRRASKRMTKMPPLREEEEEAATPAGKQSFTRKGFTLWPDARYYTDACTLLPGAEMNLNQEVQGPSAAGQQLAGIEQLAEERTSTKTMVEMSSPLPRPPRKS